MKALTPAERMKVRMATLLKEQLAYDSMPDVSGLPVEPLEEQAPCRRDVVVEEEADDELGEPMCHQVSYGLDTESEFEVCTEQVDQWRRASLSIGKSLSYDGYAPHQLWDANGDGDLMKALTPAERMKVRMATLLKEQLAYDSMPDVSGLPVEPLEEQAPCRRDVVVEEEADDELGEPMCHQVSYGLDTENEFEVWTASHQMRMASASVWGRHEEQDSTALVESLLESRVTTFSDHVDTDSDCEGPSMFSRSMCSQARGLPSRSCALPVPAGFSTQQSAGAAPAPVWTVGSISPSAASTVSPCSSGASMAPPAVAFFRNPHEVTVSRHTGQMAAAQISPSVRASCPLHLQEAAQSHNLLQESSPSLVQLSQPVPARHALNPFHALELASQAKLAQTMPAKQALQLTVLSVSSGSVDDEMPMKSSPKAAKKAFAKFSSNDAMATDYTTLMVRNLPLDLVQSVLALEVDKSGFAGQYDFLYMPSSFGTGLGKGYAFINFVSTSLATAFGELWHGSCRFSTSSCKLKVIVASLQGLEANVKRWDTSKMRRIRNVSHRPIVAGTVSMAAAEGTPAGVQERASESSTTLVTPMAAAERPSQPPPAASVPVAAAPQAAFNQALIGQWCKVQNLLDSPELNGRWAMVDSFDVACRRYTVRIALDAERWTPGKLCLENLDVPPPARSGRAVHRT